MSTTEFSTSEKLQHPFRPFPEQCLYKNEQKNGIKIVNHLPIVFFYSLYVLYISCVAERDGLGVSLVTLG